MVPACSLAHSCSPLPSFECRPPSFLAVTYSRTVKSTFTFACKRSSVTRSHPPSPLVRPTRRTLPPSPSPSPVTRYAPSLLMSRRKTVRGEVPEVEEIKHPKHQHRHLGSFARNASRPLLRVGGWVLGAIKRRLAYPERPTPVTSVYEWVHAIEQHYIGSTYVCISYSVVF
ncbi:hypothetical protein OG21DRAFT_149695 [Imleria badia]|nr:hypothetical protein OG21DRAFT_149695 [Imleria badia]